MLMLPHQQELAVSMIDRARTAVVKWLRLHPKFFRHWDDFQSDAQLAVCKAAVSWQEERQVPFRLYVRICVMNSIKDRADLIVKNDLAFTSWDALDQTEEGRGAIARHEGLHAQDGSALRFGTAVMDRMLEEAGIDPMLYAPGRRGEAGHDACTRILEKAMVGLEPREQKALALVREGKQREDAIELEGFTLRKWRTSMGKVRRAVMEAMGLAKPKPGARREAQAPAPATVPEARPLPLGGAPGSA